MDIAGTIGSKYLPCDALNMYITNQTNISKESIAYFLSFLFLLTTNLFRVIKELITTGRITTLGTERKENTLGYSTLPIYDKSVFIKEQIAMSIGFHSSLIVIRGIFLPPSKELRVDVFV